MRIARCHWLAGLLLGALLPAAVAMAADTPKDIWNDVEHRYADSSGVRIHYAALGQGPLVVMIHGFPDFWYSWRDQMQALAASQFRVVAIDQRGYNLSDKPKGVESYLMPRLVDDVAAVIKAEQQPNAIVVGHDWGGAVAWNVAMSKPEIVRLLVILNLPHPAGIGREIATNPEQKKNSAYAFNFQKPDAHKQLTAEGLAQWVKNPAARVRYVEAFKLSDFESMLNYYKANYPRPDAPPAATPPSFPKVKAPVLMVHGLDDKALLPGALSGTWNWVEKDLTLVTIPGAGHFVQQDAAGMVSETMVDWLRRREPASRLATSR
ncbi:pimeloyl-ACP methyl ester carboxylesterase [Povalibacter uvarum]|uniref:Pimeloyl-ACP methyl ester carboxylesterase n=1 Tax=Povalibacter uvarum TaxID=732238 RepID=A0A841HKN7_9GAMM|nr:alpha/beta hydrolase [Povalibacter uvarum]MBB6092939.1 pimeloyl-ACP methyl ester carboxylesterase [Povalibacter uvarum]